MSRQRAFTVLSLCLGLAAYGPAAAVTAAAPAAATGYHYHRLAVKRDGSTCTNLVANSENNHGTILGTVYCGDSRGFIEHAGRVHQFAAPGPPGTDTLPGGIADNGTIALITQVNYAGPITSYLRRPSGHFTKIRDPHAGRYGTNVESVNSHGEAVGFYMVGKSRTRIRPFIERHGSYHSFRLGVKHAKNVALIDVNQHGDLTGTFQRDGRSLGFVVLHGHVHVIEAPGAGHAKGEGTEVLAISDNGRYWCGTATFARGDEYQDTNEGFVEHDGRFRVVRVPSRWGHSSAADAVDNKGTVVGSFIYSNDVTWVREGFRATR